MATKSKQSVSAIVVPFKGSPFLGACLASVQAQEQTFSQVIVVANGYSVQEGKELSQRYPWVEVVARHDEPYYCQGLNDGLERASGEFVLCMNDDVELSPGFLKRALPGFSVSPGVGMVCAKLLRPGGKVIDSAGMMLTPWRTARERGYNQVDQGRFEKPGFVFGVCGAAGLYRRAMLDDIREEGWYFDPAFNMFYEDLDVAWRAQRKGWKAYYMPKAVAYHHRGGTARSPEGVGKPVGRRFLSKELRETLVRNRYRTMFRNETPLSLVFHLPLALGYDLLLWFYLLMGTVLRGDMLRAACPRGARPRI